MSRVQQRIEWNEMGLQFFLLKCNLMGFGTYYCGYVTFPKRPLLETSYDGIAAWVDVHGGLTFAEENKDGSFTYGFDCAHVYDERNPLLQNVDYLKTECWCMAVNIQVAVEFEPEYLATDGYEAREILRERYEAACNERRAVLTEIP